MVGALLALALLCGVEVESKNMDTLNAQLFKGKTGALFGYSLAAHDHGVDRHAHRLIIGAPGENSEEKSPNGAVYLCDISTTSCTVMQISLSKSEKTSVISQKWLGATVLSQNGMILVCAPNLGHQSAGKCFFKYNNRSDELGLDDNYFEKLPHIAGWRDEALEMCANGMSATLLASIQEETFRPTIVTSAATCIHEQAKGAWIYSSDISKTFSNSNSYKNNDFPGYALTAGVLRRNQSSATPFLATSVGGRSRHRDSSSFAGMVQILEFTNGTKTISKQTHLYDLNGRQDGEYFGASLAAFDLNGDDRDDLIVGAPIHSRYFDEKTEYETGAVYIFYQSIDGSFNESGSKSASLFGKAIGSRFGFAVAGLGDTNGDKFNDLAVGAPYENNGHGAVYIFHGSEQGIESAYAQVIYGRQFEFPLQTFGWSFTSADFDGNGYSDIVVGAPQSSTAVYIRARPLITITTSVSIEPRNITFSGERCESLGSRNSSDHQLTCAEVEYCLSFSGKLIAADNEILFELKIKLAANGTSIGEKSSRPFSFVDGNRPFLHQNISLRPEKLKCWRKHLKAEQFSYGNLTLSAILEVSVGPKIPGLLLPLVNGVINNNSFAKMDVRYTVTPPAASVADLPWWIYLTCAVGALLIILLIFVVLNKLGFFKRTRPPTGEHAQEPASTINEETIQNF